MKIIFYFTCSYSLSVVLNPTHSLPSFLLVQTLYSLKLKLKLNYDRQSVGQSVLVSGTHLGPATNSFFLEIFFRQLQVCYFVAPSLTRGRVCNLLLLLVLASAVPLGSECGTQDHILLSQFLRLPQPGGPGHRIYIPQEQGGSSPLTTRRATMEVFSPASTRDLFSVRVR
jgi:hypothetical protein